MSGPEQLQSQIQQEISELTASVSGLIENFHRLRNPLVESHDKVPQATIQLDKISEQTEAAAHRLLDLVEQITEREDKVLSGLAEVSKLVEAGDIAAIRPVISKLETHANRTLADAYTMMDALQFQDITSQQMNHAAALLEDIQGKLHSILEIIVGDSFTACFGELITGSKKRAYDPHADMNERRTQQEDIDNLFAQTRKK